MPTLKGSRKSMNSTLSGLDGIARAIAPSHTPHDGDLVFAAATGARPGPSDGGFVLGHAAACVLARAIARAVFLAQPMPGDRQPCWSARFAGAST